MLSKPVANTKKGIKYGIWTIIVYVLVFQLLWLLAPSSLRDISVAALPWFVFSMLLPFMITLVFLVTGYAALKGDKAQIFPAIIHGTLFILLICSGFNAAAFIIFTKILFPWIH